MAMSSRVDTLKRLRTRHIYGEKSTREILSIAIWSRLAAQVEANLGCENTLVAAIKMKLEMKSLELETEQ